MPTRFVVMVMIVQSFSCTTERTEPRGVESAEVRHPVPGFMLGSDQPTADVSLNRPDQIPEQFKAIEGMLVAAASVPPTTVIGMRGEPSQVFAHVALAAIDHRGGLVTIDDRLNAVTSFPSTGNFRHDLGRSGRGEGEYSDPRALAVSPRGDVLVGEMGRRLHVFRLNRTGYERGRTYDADISVQDMCFLGNTLFVHARPQENNALLYEVDSVGKVRKSFGELYKSPNKIVNIEIARGGIACAERERAILYAPTAGVAELRAFAPDGKLRWTTKLRGYRSIEMVQPAGKPQNSRIWVPANGAYRLESMTYHPSGFFVIQLALVTMQSIKEGREYDGLTTLILSALDGRGISIGEKLPLIGALDENLVWFVRNDSLPGVFGHSLNRRNSTNDR